MPFKGQYFSETAAGTTSAAITLSAGSTYYVTDVGASTSGTPGTITIKSGSTTIWEQQLSSAPYEKSFVTPLRVIAGNDLVITATGSTATYVNISGFSL